MSRSPAKPQPAAVSDAAPVFAALGDQTRLNLIARLSAGEPMSIKRLTAGTNMTRQAVTQHLEVLADAGLVTSVRQGRERVWAPERARLDLARRSLDQIAAWWDEKLAALKTSLEGIHDH